MKKLKFAKLPGRLSISFVRVLGVGANAEDHISIAFRDDASGVQFLSCNIPPAVFADCAFGHREIEVEFELVRPDLVGCRSEHKTIEIEWEIAGRDDEKKMRAALAKHETEGWVGDVGDLTNGHRRRGRMQSVTFRRHVLADGTPVLK